MRLRRHINERITRKEEEEIAEVLEYIEVLEKNCSKIINIYKKTGNFLYRGIKSKERFIEKKGRTKVRKPRNTDIVVHRYVNELFKEKFGWKVRDGIPTTSHFAQARFYGEPYLFFPVNRYKFVWSPEIRDLFAHAPVIPFMVDKPKEWIKTKRRSYMRLINKYQDTNLEKAFGAQAGVEIFFKTSKYYLLSWRLEKYVRDMWDMGQKKGFIVK